jgi:hypothetical protein
MSDLTLALIGLTTMVGYFFSKDGRVRRGQSPREQVAQNDFPNGKNIYHSDKVNEVNAELLKHSLETYKDAESPAQTGIVHPLFNANAKSLPSRRVIEETNKLKDVIKKDEVPLEKRPMFTPTKYIGNETPGEIGENIIDSEISILTGLPIEKSHHNMVPFFGSNVRQNIEKFTNEPLLERHTANQSAFSHKQEVESFFKPTSQDIHGTPIFTAEINTDRYIPSLIRSNEKPFQEQKISAPISGTIENKIMPVYKDTNELRAANKPKLSYEARTIAGQMGEVRGIQSAVEKMRPETFYEKTQDHLFRTTGEFTAPNAREDFSTNFRATARKDYNIEQLGTATSNIAAARQRVQIEGCNTECDTNASQVQPAKRNNFQNDYIGPMTGNQQANDYGKSSMKSYETERATTSQQSHIPSANRVSFGVKPKLGDLPRGTLKETTLEARAGHVKTTFDQGSVAAFGSGISTIDMKTTHKETTIVNNYQGIVDNKQGGMSYLVNSYRNADIRDTKEKTLSGERPSGPQMFQTAKGKESFGDVKITGNMLLKEREDVLIPKNQLQTQIIPDKNIVGIHTKWNVDDGRQDTVFADRLLPELVQSQHDKNPFSIYKKE